LCKAREAGVQVHKTLISTLPFPHPIWILISFKLLVFLRQPLHQKLAPVILPFSLCPSNARVPKKIQPNTVFSLAKLPFDLTMYSID
jgi:hypothetical protein